MSLRAHGWSKDGKQHRCWSGGNRPHSHGPRQRTLSYLGELNDSAQARLKSIEVFDEKAKPSG